MCDSYERFAVCCMSIRFKLLVLLLALSLLPLGILRTLRGGALEQLGVEMGNLTREALLENAKNQLLTTVEDQARLLDQGARLLTLALASQADRAAQFIENGGRPDATDSVSLTVSEAVHELTSWQVTALEDGRMQVYPEGYPLPPQFDPRHAKWYRDALRSGKLVWTIPSVEPSTHQVTITVSMPLRDASGRTVGVTAIMAPFSRLLADSFRAQGLTPEIKAFLVSTDASEGTSQGLPLIAQYEATSAEVSPENTKFAWCCPSGQLRLSADDPQLGRAMLEDLRSRKSNYRQAFYEGRDALWAYAPTDQWGAALVIVAPVDHMMQTANLARQRLEERVAQQADTSLRFVLAAMAIIATMALWVAGRVTRPIRDLALATERIAQGDLETKVEPHGKDELASLGHAFNNMVPRLRDHARLIEAIALAEELQKNLLPESLPQFAGLEIAAQTKFCEEVGGDFYDVIKDAHGYPGCLSVLLGDVSGHGLDAALLMATARAFLRLRANQNGTPAEVVCEVNRFLTLDTDGTGRFMTLFYMEFDRAAGMISWVRAGHDPAMLFDPEQSTFTELIGPGIPLGVVRDYAFLQQDRCWLLPGQVLLIGSDGLWEARNSFGEMFGKDRTKDVIKSNAELSSQSILDALLASQSEFVGTDTSEDDITLIVIKATQVKNAKNFCWLYP
ncbi:Serine phosphatase RsbU, regulator of sigma subunit [Desulfovibrio sp. TomC]|nr:Serine phosphatase RsbU, regulator of sigma subunit [Desulfovibrio sp. TomC]